MSALNAFVDYIRNEPTGSGSADRSRPDDMPLAEPPPPAPATGAAPLDLAGFQKSWAAAQAVWQTANSKVDAQIARFAAKLKALGDTELTEIADKGLGALTANHKIKLMAALTNVRTASADALRSTAPAAKTLIADFRNHLSRSEKIAFCDEQAASAFGVKIAIRAEIGAALNALENVLQRSLLLDRFSLQSERMNAMPARDFELSHRFLTIPGKSLAVQFTATIEVPPAIADAEEEIDALVFDVWKALVQGFDKRYILPLADRADVVAARYDQLDANLKDLWTTFANEKIGTAIQAEVDRVAGLGKQALKARAIRAGKVALNVASVTKNVAQLVVSAGIKVSAWRGAYNALYDFYDSVRTIVTGLQTKCCDADAALKSLETEAKKYVAARADGNRLAQLTSSMKLWWYEPVSDAKKGLGNLRDELYIAESACLKVGELLHGALDKATKDPAVAAEYASKLNELLTKLANDQALVHAARKKVTGLAAKYDTCRSHVDDKGVSLNDHLMEATGISDVTPTLAVPKHVKAPAVTTSTASVDRPVPAKPAAASVTAGTTPAAPSGASTPTALASPTSAVSAPEAPSVSSAAAVSAPVAPEMQIDDKFGALLEKMTREHPELSGRKHFMPDGETIVAPAAVPPAPAQADAAAPVAPEMSDEEMVDAFPEELDREHPELSGQVNYTLRGHP